LNSKEKASDWLDGGGAFWEATFLPLIDKHAEPVFKTRWGACHQLVRRSTIWTYSMPRESQEHNRRRENVHPASVPAQSSKLCVSVWIKLDMTAAILSCDFMIAPANYK
jgi:hypothetical protein